MNDSIPRYSHRAAGPAPDVSILMTVLNNQGYLAAAIESVLAQRNAPSWELLIVDDGSADDSVRIAQSFSDAYPEIRLFQHPDRLNHGISASRNLALRYARAPVLAFLDSDDVWLPHRLCAQLPLLHAHPEAAILYAQAERWFDFAQPFPPAGPTRNFTPPLIPPGARAGLLRPPQLLEWFLADESMTPCTCCVLVYTAAARAAGGFEDPFAGVYDDQVFYAKLALAHPVLVSQQVVARYRQHASSCCARARSSHTGEDGRTRFLAWLERYSGAAHAFAPPAEPEVVQRALISMS